ncbi:MAG: flagellar motor protein MotD [Proteobacteria bacterium]|nr:flagellar motor protein MotD [Pseudomonadota bacterium]HQR05107.1 flagellar motor protein MotD [Rhodocyclaceae bacterium]
MSRRRPHEEEYENHDRWLVSYADFITLLFAFFVVMYAISSVNEGKYRVLSDALTSAFKNVPGNSSGALVSINPNAPTPIAIPLRKPQPGIKADANLRQNRERMQTMAKDIKEALSPLVKDGMVRITENGRGLTIEINASVLFAPGDATLDPVAIKALTAVAKVMASDAFPVVVEGHTDNSPINSPMFPSNWELSGVRASSVVRLFIANGVDPRRLTAIGYADQRPVADNVSAEGRQRNRRVAINIEAQSPDTTVEVPVR